MFQWWRKNRALRRTQIGGLIPLLMLINGVAYFPGLVLRLPAAKENAKKAGVKTPKKKTPKKAPEVEWKKVVERTRENKIPLKPRREVSQTYLDARDYLRAKRLEREARDGEQSDTGLGHD